MTGNENGYVKGQGIMRDVKFFSFSIIIFIFFLKCFM